MEPTPCPRCPILERRIAELEAKVHALTEQVEQLTRLLEESRRAGKRQAAPFSKKPPKPNPQKPGRKPGEDYGVKAYRQPPAAKQIDEEHDAPLPEACPGCSGTVRETGIVHQYQTEIPRRPIYRRFTIHRGRCTGCGRRLQGRHPLQTSEAVGAAAAQLGPDLQAALVILNKHAGLSHGKVRHCLQALFGIRLTRGGSAQAILRAGRRCRPIYQRLRQKLRAARRVTLDETGWRIGGLPAWLHTLVSRTATVYEIARTRDHTVAEGVLGADYAGTLIHDGWAPYDRFTQARHQQCLAHLLRRCRELLETATRGAVRFPRQIQAWLKTALRLRDRLRARQISAHGLAVARGRLHGQLLDRIWPRKTHVANERLARHLWNHRDHLLTFLTTPGVDATNWRAEQALRPAVVNRKVWGGNRTLAGSHAQAVLASVLQTCRQQGRDVLELLNQTLRHLPAPALAG
jgi:transposase